MGMRLGSGSDGVGNPLGGGRGKDLGMSLTMTTVVAISCFLKSLLMPIKPTVLSIVLEVFQVLSKQLCCVERCRWRVQDDVPDSRLGEDWSIPLGKDVVHTRGKGGHPFHRPSYAPSSHQVRRYPASGGPGIRVGPVSGSSGGLGVSREIIQKQSLGFMRPEDFMIGGANGESVGRTHYIETCRDDPLSTAKKEIYAELGNQLIHDSSLAQLQPYYGVLRTAYGTGEYAVVKRVSCRETLLAVPISGITSTVWPPR